MDRDPNHRPNTAGELLDHLESSIHSPNGSSADAAKWLKPMIRARGIGVGALLMAAIGVAELTWVFAGPGSSIVARAAHRLFG